MDNWQGMESITQAEHLSPGKTGDNIVAKRVAMYEALDGVKWSRAGSPQAVKMDNDADPIIYIGKAPVGSATSDPVWQIAKLDTSSGLSKTWAGSAGFDQVWDDHTSLTYI